MKTKVYSFDLETTGLNPHTGDRAFTFAIGYPDGKFDTFDMDKVGLKYLKTFWNDSTIEKANHNIKFDMSFMPYHGISIPANAVIHDTMVQSQMLRNLSNTHGLDDICWELCNFPKEQDKEISRMAKELGGYDKIPRDKMKFYQGCDVKRVQIIHQAFFPEIKANAKLYEDYLEEMELLKTTLWMESYGICIDKKACNKLINWLEFELDTLHDEVYELLGYRANLGSGQQVQDILFNKYKFTPLHFGKSGPSVDIDTINYLRENNKSPILELILKHRTYTGGISKISSYMEIADKSKSGYVIHPSIKTNGAARTGRESSENPNLQNISKNTNLINPYSVPARKVFKTYEGRILYLVDYAGIEMRIIVDACRCKPLMEIINGNGDVHLPAAESFYGKKFTDLDTCFKYMIKLSADNKKVIKELKEEEAFKRFKKTIRSSAKNGHFAMAYGSSLSNIATTLNLEIGETQIGFERYANLYPEVAYFTRNIVKEVKENGFIETAFGRKLFVLKNQAYVGANYKIQGTAAGVLKRAQNKVKRYILENDLPTRLILPVHDELLLSNPLNMVSKEKDFLPAISREMTQIKHISVRLDVEWKRSFGTWDKAKEIKVIY